MAQALSLSNLSFVNVVLSAKGMRSLCDQYMKEDKNTGAWIKNRMDKSANMGGQNYQTCKMQIAYTNEEIKRMKENDPLYKNWGDATLGRPNIEGIMILKKIKELTGIDVQLHVMEIQDLRDKKVEEAMQNKIMLIRENSDPKQNNVVQPRDIDYQSNNVIHLACYRNHFVPLRRVLLDKNHKHNSPTVFP